MAQNGHDGKRPALPTLLVYYGRQQGEPRYTLRFRIPLAAASPHWQEILGPHAQGGVLTLHGRTDLDFSAQAEIFYEQIDDYFHSDPDNNPLFDRDMNNQSDERLLESQEAGRELMTALSQRGYHVFRQLFVDFTQAPQPERRIPPETFQAAKACLREMLANEHNPLCISFIEFPRPASLFPWTLLFDRKLTGKETWEECWKACLAFRHQIEDLPDWASRADSFARLGRAHVAVCPHVDYHRVHRSAPHPLSGSAEPSGFSLEQISTLTHLRQRLVAVDGVIVSFFGHADSAIDNDAMANYLELSGERLTVADLQAATAPKYVEEVVFVFLNGCEVASMSLRSITANTLVGRLSELGEWEDRRETGRAEPGRVHFLTTCHKLPCTFGALFSRQFWAQFCAGKPVGQALLESRQHMASTYGNPFGLLYSLFGKGALAA
jgi:hypothetical protein